MRSGHHIKIVGILLAAGIIGIMGFKFLWPMVEEFQQRDTSDARTTKGKITIGYDNWIGYFPLCSNEMRKRMRQTGYNLICEDDHADYDGRMKKLSKGKLQFAVATVDSYLLNAEPYRFPGTIVAVIDESKGGDAIVANEELATSIDDLKLASNYKIAFTPGSPSEHLIKTVAVHFDIPSLKRTGGATQVHTDGSTDALDKLLSGEVQVAVLWEPDVSKALMQKRFKKLLGTEDTNKLIVDILIVNREFSRDNSEAVQTLLQQYFRTLKFYKDNPDQLHGDAAAKSDVNKKQVATMLKGVQWVNLIDNNQIWFGAAATSAGNSEWLIDSLEGASQILVDHGDFSSDPIPDHDPYRLTNSQFIHRIYRLGVSQFGVSATPQAAAAQQRAFAVLGNREWEKLREVGTLKIRPIVFQSGAGSLTIDGKEQLDKAAENLSHYPNYRILVKGHTGLRGDSAANRTLSQERAESVTRYLAITHQIGDNRMRAVGWGSSLPLAKNQGESDRSYNYRLPRVELALVAEDI